MIALGAGALAPLELLAKQRAKSVRIGVLLTLYSANEGAPGELRKGLRSLGYREGKNAVIEWRSAEGDYDRLPALAAELAKLKLDVIVTDVTLAARAAHQASAKTPIVFMAAADPVDGGLVASLARPGGNITGLSILLSDIGAKRLQLLSEAVPKVTRVGAFWNPETKYHANLLKEIQAAAGQLKLEILPVAMQKSAELEAGFAALTKANAHALYVADDPMFFKSRNQLADLALKNRLATVFSHPDFVTAGGLLAYGANLGDMFRSSAMYVDKILKGRKPADLPVEQAARLDLSINLKTAAALGLTVSDSIRAQATRVIE